jgi:probable rRNA maturation factor
MNVEYRDEQDEPHPAPGDLIALAEDVLRAEGLPDRSEVSLLLVGTERIAELNRRHLGRDGPTDVLAFPLREMQPGAPPGAVRGGPPLALGDVLICPAVVASNARAARVPFDDEMALMVVHGMLHLLGYDHTEDGDAAVMEERERELLAAAGRVRP